MSNKIRIPTGDWSRDMFRRLRAMVAGVSDRVEVIETEGVGKIDTIMVNGVTQPIVNKTVDLALSVPITNAEIDEIVDASEGGTVSLLRFVTDVDQTETPVSEALSVWQASSLSYTATATEVS